MGSQENIMNFGRKSAKALKIKKEFDREPTFNETYLKTKLKSCKG